MKALKIIRNIVISVIALLLLLVGGGVTYTWYIGQKEPIKPDTEIAPVKQEVNPIPKPTKPAANAKASAVIQSLSSPINPGSNASVYARTLAGSECTIQVVYNNVASKDSGLKPKIADDYGTVNWTWTVENTVPIGKWPVTVTCVYNKTSAVVRADLEVTNKPVE
jgi:hypothetical protein